METSELTQDPVDVALNTVRQAGKVEPGRLPVPEHWNEANSLRPYQSVGALHLIVKRRFILGDPTGSGKTPQELYAWGCVRDVRLRENRVPRLWLVTTKSAAEQWEEEIEKFYRGVNIYRVPTETSRQQRVAFVKEWLEDTTGAVLITNWAQFTNDWQHIRLLRDPKLWIPETTVTFDEAQKLKNPESKLYKVAWDVCNEHQADRVHGLTATLVKNRAEDSQAIINLICPGLVTRLEFENKYCIIEKRWIKPKGSRHARKVNMTVGYRDLNKYAESIVPVYLGRRDEEIEGERPEVTFMSRKVRMSPEQAAVYEEAEQGLLLSDPTTVGAAAMVHAQQASNNPEIWYNEPNLIKKTQQSAKCDLLKELLEDELKDEHVIVYSHLETTISAYEKQLDQYSPVRITGKEDTATREKARTAFNTGISKLLLLTNAGSESLNLQVARHVVLLNRPWDPGSYVQIVGRARRFGSSHKSIVVWHLSCADTIDELVDAVLLEKFGNFEQILRTQGNYLSSDQITPKEIALHARKRRMQEGKDRRRL